MRGTRLRGGEHSVAALREQSPGTAGEPGPSLYMGSDPQRRELIGYAYGTGTSTCVPETSSLQANRVFAPHTPLGWQPSF
jgi:hypothetical protein